MELKKNDIIKIITLIKVNYDNAYPDGDGESTKTLIEFWYNCLKKYPKEIVFQAVENTVKHCKFTPRLADIIEEIDKILISRAPSLDALWEELTSILLKVFEVSRYIGYPQYSQWTNEQLDGLYDSLNPELKLYVTTRSALVQLSELSGESLQYERVRFLKAMPEIRNNYYENLGSDKIAALLENADGDKQIPGNGVKQITDKK